MRCLIRRANAGDIDDVVEIINRTNYEAYRDIVPPKYFKYPFVDSNYIAAIFSKWFIYVAEVDEKPVGCACLEMNNSLGVIHLFYVLPEYQRKGIGSELLVRVEMDALSYGVKEIRIHVDSKAYWAISFYSKAGYEVNGLYRHIISDDYQPLIIILSKQLKI